MSLPLPQGLYHPVNEHDACGVGFVANIKGKKSHTIVEQGLTVLRNLTHRGAVGYDPKLSDGAGLLIQIPHRFFRDEMAKQGVKLPPAGQYGVGMVFLPRDPASRIACEYEIERAIKDEGQVLLGWRDVPVDNGDLADAAKKLEPVIRQVFIGRGRGVTVADALERKLYIIRKSSGHAIQALKLQHAKAFYVPSMSARIICYKGMLLAYQVGEYYLELKDARVESALALVHQRFSTNTFPSWDLAHPFRMICHNGEINTLRGNVNWIRARQGAISSPILGKDLDKIFSQQHERVIDNDNTVRFEGRSLQIPQQTFRFSMARCRVLVCEHLDQTLSVHYGHHLLGRYDASGQLLQLAGSTKTVDPTDRRRLMKAQAHSDRHREERKKNQKRKKEAA